MGIALRMLAGGALIRANDILLPKRMRHPTINVCTFRHLVRKAVLLKFGIRSG